MVAISLSPNSEKDDRLLALKCLLAPGKWQQGEAIAALETWFKRFFKVSEAQSFNSGRSALYAILKAANIGAGDEVLLQAFTCVAVPNAVLWTGARPVFVDINKSDYNLDLTALRQKITPRTKAVIVQHTFGIPADIAGLQKLAREKRLVLIEDCAHALGAKRHGRKIGSFGDYAFFSFGRDKIVSSVCGGLAIANGKNSLVGFRKKLAFPNHFWILQQLLHPLAFGLILPFYNVFALGKILLFILQRLKLLGLPVSPLEKETGRPQNYPEKMPNALAVLALNQLQKLVRFNAHRQKIAAYYGRELILPVRAEAVYLRYPLLVKGNGDLFAAARKKNILLGHWYADTIDPYGVNLSKLGYQPGSCPVAENLAAQIVNLPTGPNITLDKAKMVVAVLKKAA